MRAPFQILAIPYRLNPELEYCVFHRADFDQFQFIAGGGEDDEKPSEAARREIREETGIRAEKLTELKSMTYIPTNIFPEKYLKLWPEGSYVIPEYAFAFECGGEIKLSGEHTSFEWLRYADAAAKLSWDSNKTALYELSCRLRDGRARTD